MTRERLEALIDCPRFYWIEGMRHLPTGDGESDYRPGGRVRNPQSVSVDALPDLTDPGTMGFLLALVRDAHKTLASTEYVGDGDQQNPWRFLGFRGETEEDVLVLALLGAPC